jgi:hypothetical protein
MTTPKNTLNSLSDQAQHDQNLSLTESDEAVKSFICVYNARAAYFADPFIKKLKEGNRKALAELQRYPLPATQMDLRQEFAKCVKANISDEHLFPMKDGKRYTMQDLKRLVPEWCGIAEKALIDSDPAWADKLMSAAQWNARSAFEVTFVSAMNELKDLKKSKEAAATFDRYLKWTIDPLEKAIEQVKAVNPPGNSLVGYGNRISLAQAMVIAAGLKGEFQKLLTEKTK